MGGFYGKTVEVFFHGSHFALGEERLNPFTNERMRGWEAAMDDDELSRVERLVASYGATLEEGAVVDLEAQRTDSRRPRVVLHDFGREGGAAQLFGDFDSCCAFVFELAKAGNLIVNGENTPDMVTNAEVRARALAAPDGSHSECELVASAAELRQAFGDIVEC